MFLLVLIYIIISIKRKNGLLAALLEWGLPVL